MKRLLVTVAMVVMMAGILSAQIDLQPIANVKLQKSEPITLKQLKSRVDSYQKEIGRTMTLDERKQVLDTIINERLVVQAAERDGVKVTDSEVNQNFQTMISQQVGQEITETDFIALIKQKTGMTIDDFMKAQNGMTLSEYKTFLKSQLLAQRYVLAKKQAEIQNMAGPTDSAIRSYYELVKTAGDPTLLTDPTVPNFVQSDMVKIFLVVVPKGDTPDAAKAKLADLQKQLKANPAAANDIKAKSTADKAGYDAGVLYINKNDSAAKQLGITMDNLIQIFKMDLNQVSDVTETPNDFQCFLLQEKYGAKILALDDVVKPGTTVTVYEYIKNLMLAQSQNKAVNEALLAIINDLRKPENFQILKSGAELDKVLTW